MGTLIKSIKLTPAIPPVVTLKSEDGKYHLGIKSLCSSLGVSKTGQMQRIRSTPELASALHYESIETPGGQQKLAVMEIWGVSIWAATLHISRLLPPAQEAALLLKRDAFEVIKSRFEEATSGLAPAIEGEPMQQPVAALSPFDKIIEAVSELKEDYTALQQRLALLEQLALGSRKIHGASMSAEQIGQVILQLRLLRERRGISIEEAEKMVAAEFGVAHLSDIDSAHWTDIVQQVHQLFQQGHKP